ncbi:hypothetical protein [Mycobacteroides abscessus]|uniref:hypothetical protein n=1 Tax=Mycobacteroides abscessus TaxID=36809 RepID=UPI0009A565E7|nr:hypothetical protein [Mycobacteroides abscessus]SKD80878.1 Uncharacterised protein [Mycobacteroides abscessus subsp. massiliense]SKH38878.1 Uncharacterised protein [Mycobacteroides abscessus subsp. massiliense]SKI31319.1 Uncharacterised protein [Mycobacteroides abscessus subsp. massiliense]SKJ17165.1 Uncharacterised protein [Mycobacteroides abscessus subsp. massiliense]SKJ90322.1 Uncharacterised protein [Mycobacteroides abscessus subsp. massiliense]
MRATPDKTGAGARRGAATVAADLRRADSGRAGWLMALGVVVFAAAVLGAVLLWHPQRAPSAPSAAQGLDHPPATVASGSQELPPWPVPADASAAAAAAGLPMARMEGTVEHIHAHVDVLVNNQRVPVPANIGVDVRRGAMTALHTHDDSGVVHVESPLKRPFSLGELFTQWQVMLTADQLGGLHADGDKQLRVIVNGAARPGNPAAILLADHDEIAIVYGTPHPGETIPSTYQFPNGQ